MNFILLFLTIILIIFFILILIYLSYSIFYNIYYDSFQVSDNLINGKNEKVKNFLKDKLVIVTGCTSGIGFESVKVLASLGCDIIMGNRNMKKSENVKKKIIEYCLNKNKIKPNIKSIKLDLESLEMVENFSKEVLKNKKPLALILNNAGMVAPIDKKTSNGFEHIFQVNYLSHFYLTYLLLPKIQKEQNTETRIINISSLDHEKIQEQHLKHDIFKFWKTNGSLKQLNFYKYHLSKFALNLFTIELDKYLKKNKINATTNSVHPGLVKTNFPNLMKESSLLMKLVYFLASPFTKTAKSGSQTTLYCCLSPEIKNISGKYFGEGKEKPQNKLCFDKNLNLSQKLWNWSIKELKV